MEQKGSRQKPNYRRQMDEIVAGLEKEGARKRLLLHACCAPCSTSCLELLTRFFDVTVLFYNPNITEEAEYRRRLEEEKRLIGIFNDALLRTGPGADDCGTHRGAEGLSPGETQAAVLPDKRTAIQILESRYDPEAFFAVAKGYESAPEGGERCRRCFTLRLEEAARVAASGCVSPEAPAHGGVGTSDATGNTESLRPFDFFTTTLTISPLKNADLLNEIGQAAGAAYGVPFLPSDFKKKDGFLRSIQLSEQFDLYRQDYCGCIYSKAERSCAKCRAC